MTCLCGRFERGAILPCCRILALSFGSRRCVSCSVRGCCCFTSKRRLFAVETPTHCFRSRSCLRAIRRRFHGWTCWKIWFVLVNIAHRQSMRTATSIIARLTKGMMEFMSAWGFVRRFGTSNLRFLGWFWNHLSCFSLRTCFYFSSRNIVSERDHLLLVTNNIGAS